MRQIAQPQCRYHRCNQIDCTAPISVLISSKRHQPGHLGEPRKPRKLREPRKLRKPRKPRKLGELGQSKPILFVMPDLQITTSQNPAV